MTDEPDLSRMRGYISRAAQNKITAARGGLTVSHEAMLNDYVIIPEVFALLGQIAGHHILDLACGNGHLARRLAEHGAQVTAIDISDELVRSARKREVQEPRVSSITFRTPPTCR
jgi:2-polyprenyl-3-methyl-5-hydroxy-6-metoxy-1,4-benzoquinol methylase